MNPESFQFLYELINRDPLAFFGVLIAIVVTTGVFILGTRWKVHPVTLWLTLATMAYYFSQTFPENRTQKPRLIVTSAIGSAAFTFFWCRRIAPALREKFRRD